MRASVILLCVMMVAATVCGQELKSDNGKTGKKLKVYILTGQSNMTGMARKSTLEHIKMFPDTAKENTDMFDANGNPVELDQVQVSCWPKKTEQKGKLKPGYGGGRLRVDARVAGGRGQ